jgi:hypothetical protein
MTYLLLAIASLSLLGASNNIKPTVLQAEGEPTSSEVATSSMSQRLCGASKIYIDLKGFPEEWKACDFATFITAFSKGVEITLADAFYYIVLRICLQSRNNRL